MFLQKDDTVALVSPAGAIPDNTPIIAAQKILKKWHFNSCTGRHALAKHGHFAGTDQERLTDLQTAMDNENIKAIWALRGGYGSVRIVDQLDFSALKKNPKLLIGFSDITILHNKWHNEGLISLHGLMPVQFKNKVDKDVITQFKKALKGMPFSYTFSKSKYNKNPHATEGIVIGGNLANLYNVLGTHLDIDTNDKILFIEDVGEQLYSIDRMMIAMQKAGKLAKLKSLIVGNFTDIPDNTPYFGKTYQEIILEHTALYNYPVIFNVPIGHITNNYPLLLGKKLQITTENDISFAQ